MVLERILEDADYLVEPKAGFVAGFGLGLLGGFMDRHAAGMYTALVRQIPVVGDAMAVAHGVLERYAYPAGMPVSYAAAGALVGGVVLAYRREVRR